MFAIPGSRRSPGKGNGNALQYSCLENPMDRGAWYAAVHGVARGQTRLSDFTFTFHRSGLPFGPRSQASLQKAQGPGVCKLPKPPGTLGNFPGCL